MTCFKKYLEQAKSDHKEIAGFKMPKNKLTVEQAHEQLEAARKKD